MDVLVVGGGPAGSTLAWALRNTGLTVAIMDKSVFPRDKICAGWITPAVTRLLGIDLSDYGQGRVLQSIDGFRVGVIAGEQTEIEYNGSVTPVSYGIRRCEFDHYLLMRSQARLWLGQAFQSAHRDGNSWLVNGSIRARLVVGAGGHFCPVARELGAKLGHGELVVAAQEIEFRMTPEQQTTCAVRGVTPELYFCRDLKGYGWVFRKGNWLNVGLGREDSHRLGDHVAEFRRWLADNRRVPPDMPARFNGHAYLLANHTARAITADGVLLIGDAAGLAYPQSGEGIRPAVESGIIAADTILACAGDYHADNLSGYRTRIEQRFGRRGLSGHTDVRKDSTLKQRLGRFLLQSNWFNRHVVMDRWFLRRHLTAC